jgi:dipeptidase E
MKATLVLLGGGEIGNGETYALDQLVASLSHQPNPHVLFLGVASHDNPSYLKAVDDMYSQFGCMSLPLNLENENPDLPELRSAISWADIIYIGGGDTRHLLQRLKATRLDKLLIEALNQRSDLVVAGLSAGASMWNEYSYADCDIMEGTSDKMTFLRCLGYLPYVFSPHADQSDRAGFAHDLASLDFTTAFALENDTALVFTPKGFYPFKNDATKHVFAYYKNGDTIRKEELQ